MAKRKAYSGDSEFAASKDLDVMHPRWMGCRLTQGGADAFVTTALDFASIGHYYGDRCAVVELLNVEFHSKTVYANNNDAEEFTLSYGAVPTAIGQNFPEDNTCIMYWLNQWTYETEGGCIRPKSKRICLQTTDGYGPLIACPRIHVSFDTNGTGNTNTAFVRIWYRYRIVSSTMFATLRKSQYTY